MPEVQKELKYRNIREGIPDAVLVDLADRQAIAVQGNVSQRIADQVKYRSVRLSRGFRGSLGFTRNKFNSTIELPLGMTRDDFKKIADAYSKIAEVVKDV